MSGRVLTPADPCTFRDACTPNDAEAWVYLGRKWVGAAEAAATDERQLLTVSGLRTFVEQLAEAAERCTIADCEPYVRQLIGATERARMLVMAWDGGAPDIPGPWEPGSDILPELLKPGGALMRVLPWAVLAFLFLQDRRAR